MGKKRKAGGRPSTQKDYEEVSNGDSKLRINTYEDVADSEDEFHINRDKILLEEGPAQKRQRKLREEEEFLEPSDEEVLAVNEDISEPEDYSQDTQETSGLSNGHPQPVFPKGRRQDSDDEESAAPEEDEDASGWGTSRKDYYDADVIETEADALEEEAEAKRLQQKQLQGMTEADFGFDEAEWLEAGKNDNDVDTGGRGKVIREVLPKFQITESMGPDERSKILKMRYPEFEPLAKEFLGLQSVYDDLKVAATEANVICERKRAKSSTNSFVEDTEDSPPLAVVKHSILAAYLAALSMYFAIFTSDENSEGDHTNAMPPEELRDHAIIETLVQCRDLWHRIKDMDVSNTNGLIEDNPQNAAQEDAKAKINGIHELRNNNGERPKKRKHRKSKAQKAVETAQAEAEALRSEKQRRTEADLADLAALTVPSKRPNGPSKNSETKAVTVTDDHSDFGEATSLTPHEATEKAQRKKTLRFYTSQIAQNANKRGAAGRDAGGDADLPHRERLKDRQARLNAEAEKRGKKGGKPLVKKEMLGGSSDEEDHAVAQQLRNGEKGEDSDKYYDLVASRKASQKAAKSELAAAHAQAAREGGIVRFVEDDAVGQDGKRAISYQIEKNKGITPKRKKDVRNPRVKKRKKFEDKKKKLGSIRPVYKGGEGRGGYGGELTGIKMGLVKSVKL